MGLLKGKTIPIEVFGSVKAAKPLLSEFPKLLKFGQEIRISKSLLMQYYKKAAYQCPRRFWHHIKARDFTATYAMQCGTLFELLATGDNVHGSEINMELFKKVENLEDKDKPIFYKQKGRENEIKGYEKNEVVVFTADYLLIERRAKYFKEWLSMSYPEADYEVVTQFQLEHENIRGTCDLKITHRGTGRVILADLKYTGAVGFDRPYKSNNYELNPDSPYYFPNVKNGILDAKMYSLLYRLKYGKVPDAFIYFLADTNSGIPDVKAVHAIETTLTEEQIARFSHQVYDTVVEVNNEEACNRPSVQDCFDCPLMECTQRISHAKLMKASVTY